MDKTAKWLRAMLAFGYSSYHFWECVDLDDSSDSLDRFLASDCLENKYVRRARNVLEQDIEQLRELCRKNYITILNYTDEDYPGMLRHIIDPPPVLFVYGDPKCLNTPHAAAIVGARNCSDYSSRVANNFGYELARQGITVVSGCARGVDSAAHWGAVNAGGITIAVLGCGVLCDYPSNSLRLKQAISVRGAVISEFLPYEPPLRDYFPTRNRIISGLCECVTVVEASTRSGALNTVSHAAEQGREVFAVPPGSIFGDQYRGQMDLHKDGIEFVLSPQDIVDFINNRYI